MAATKIEISRTVKPASVPKTELMPQRPAKSAPRQNAPVAPSGDARASSRTDIGFAVSNNGAGETDSRIGANAIETRTDEMTNRKYPLGSPKFSNPWALTMPTNWTIK